MSSHLRREHSLADVFLVGEEQNNLKAEALPGAMIYTFMEETESQGGWLGHSLN